MAKKLGMESFSELGYLRMTRNCYDSNDIAVFRENVKKYVVPVCCQIKEKSARSAASTSSWFTTTAFTAERKPYRRAVRRIL